MPRYLAIQAGIGVALGLVFALSVWLGDIAGLRTLIAASGDPVVGLVFVAGSVMVILPLAFATAVALLPRSDAERGKPVPVRPVLPVEPAPLPLRRSRG